ncbi:MAG: NAD(P)-binding domain-containing protein [Pseudomonadota bacterium]
MNDTQLGSGSAEWMHRFDSAIASGDRSALRRRFEEASHWRNICGLGWCFATTSGGDAVVDRLLASVESVSARNFQLAPHRHPPRANIVGGEPVTELVFTFDTNVGEGVGVARLRTHYDSLTPDARAWSLMTALDAIAGAPGPRTNVRDESHERSSTKENWLDRRLAHQRYTDREPDVLIVGGGHAGITAAVELNQLGLDALVVDRIKRVGDNWRLRYHSLKLHNVTSVNHLPYLPFPPTFPRYIPKDKIANWLESYVEHMEVNFWTETRFETAAYDDASERWRAVLRTTDGVERLVHPAHIVMATSVSATPNLPDIPTLGAFKGEVLHSSEFPGGETWRGRRALVFGTGTSGHDIAQELYANDVEVTVIQRSPTLIVNVEPSAQLYDGMYLDFSKRTADLDLFNSSFPLALVKENHKRITKRVRELDKSILDGLEEVGFELDFGEDGTGWPLKYRTRGGGYYFNAGCSDLIAAREVGLRQYRDIECFTATGLRLRDGSRMEADLVVLATGFKGPLSIVRERFGDAIAQRVGEVWGVNPDTQELNNMWVRTAQPGLWFTGGSFSQCRIFSKYLARQILGVELGLLNKSSTRQ